MSILLKRQETEDTKLGYKPKGEKIFDEKKHKTI